MQIQDKVINQKKKCFISTEIIGNFRRTGFYATFYAS